MAEARRSSLLVYGLIFLFCAFWFYMLGARTLVPTDEARYAEIAREMANTGDFITPRLNGIKYFEKPPLQYWMTALAFKAFGIGEWQARLWTGVCGFGSIFLVAYAGRRAFGDSMAMLSALVLGSCFYWSLAGHINSLDMGLSAMLALALCSFMLAQQDGLPKKHREQWMLLCWAGMALAVLSKGLIGLLLPGGTLVFYSLIKRDTGLWKRLCLGRGLFVFFAITSPWFLMVSFANPEFPAFFFLHEHFARFTSGVHRRGGSWAYFVPYLLLGTLPWLCLLPGSLLDAWRNKANGFQARKMLLIWTVFTFLFFSVSSSKLPGYILPIFPAIALLIAIRLDSASGKEIAISSAFFGLVCFIGLFVAWKLPAFAKNAQSDSLYRAYALWVAGASLLGMAGATASAWLAFRKKMLAVILLAVAGFITSQVLLLGYEPLGRHKAGIAHVSVIKAETTADTPIYSVGHYEHALPFYLQRTLILAGEPDEMAFGLRLEPQLWIPTLAEFADTWRAHSLNGTKAIAILRPALFREFEKNGLPMRVISQDSLRVIVASSVASSAR